MQAAANVKSKRLTARHRPLEAGDPLKIFALSVIGLD
jgi:hypothetical protein